METQYGRPDLRTWRTEFERAAPIGASREYELESDELIAIAADIRKLVSRVSQLHAAAGGRPAHVVMHDLPEIIAEQLTEVLTPEAGRLLTAAVES